PKLFGLGTKHADQMCYFLQVARHPPVAVHVGRERDIAEIGEPARALHREIAQAQPLVEDEHAWPSFSAFIEFNIAAQIGAFAAVIDITGLHQTLFEKSASGISHRFRDRTRRNPSRRCDFSQQEKSERRLARWLSPV